MENRNNSWEICTRGLTYIMSPGLGPRHVREAFRFLILFCSGHVQMWATMVQAASYRASENSLMLQKSSAAC